MTSDAAAATVRPHGGTVAALWIGFAMSVAGVLLDLRWHRLHDEFEGPAQQLQAHWLAWLGAAVLFAAAGVAMSRGGSAANIGTTVVLAGASVYAVASAWHFYEHAEGRDPEMLHLVLTVAQVAMLAGVVAAAMLARTAGHRA